MLDWKTALPTRVRKCQPSSTTHSSEEFHEGKVVRFWVWCH